MSINSHESLVRRGFCAVPCPNELDTDALMPYCVGSKGHQSPKHHDPYGNEWTDPGQAVDFRPCPICRTNCSGCLEDLAAKQEGLRELLSHCRTMADGPTVDGIWGHNEVYDEIAKKLAPLLDGES